MHISDLLKLWCNDEDDLGNVISSTKVLSHASFCHVSKNAVKPITRFASHNTRLLSKVIRKINSSIDVKEVALNTKIAVDKQVVG